MSSLWRPSAARYGYPGTVLLELRLNVSVGRVAANAGAASRHRRAGCAEVQSAPAKAETLGDIDRGRSGRGSAGDHRRGDSDLAARPGISAACHDRGRCRAWGKVNLVADRRPCRGARPCCSTGVNADVRCGIATGSTSNDGVRGRRDEDRSTADSKPARSARAGGRDRAALGSAGCRGASGRAGGAISSGFTREPGPDKTLYA